MLSDRPPEVVPRPDPKPASDPRPARETYPQLPADLRAHQARRDDPDPRGLGGRFLHEPIRQPRPVGTRPEPSHPDSGHHAHLPRTRPSPGRPSPGPPGIQKNTTNVLIAQS